MNFKFAWEASTFVPVSPKDFRALHSHKIRIFLILCSFVPVAQLDRALACGAKGRRFESCQAYQIKK